MRAAGRPTGPHAARRQDRDRRPRPDPGGGRGPPHRHPGGQRGWPWRPGHRLPPRPSHGVGYHRRPFRTDSFRHAVYGTEYGNTCVNDAVNAYLTNGNLPRTDLKCAANRP
ncbi:alpha/beta hydrolase [Streptomyces sp. UNOB3_S3]|nr:alpha/beta hydrolase [Streptomyces sp. UNOB3_S3]